MSPTIKTREKYPVYTKQRKPGNQIRIGRAGDRMVIVNDAEIIVLTNYSIRQLRKQIEESNEPVKLTFKGLSRAQTGQVLRSIKTKKPMRISRCGRTDAEWNGLVKNLYEVVVG